MSKTDLDLNDIIHSPEAEAFLRMVTKGFYDSSYTGLWLHEVIGREWDDMARWAEGMKTEIHPQTCTWSIAIWEWAYGIESDDAIPLELRRQKIFAKIIGVKPINPEVMRRGIAALTGRPNSDVAVKDFIAPYTFGIKILASPKEYPAAEIVKWVRDVKPAHLAFEIAVETQAAIQGKISTAAGAITMPKIVITNLQTFRDVHLQHSESIGAAAIGAARTVITNNAGKREETITANIKAGAAAIHHTRAVITNNAGNREETVSTAQKARAAAIHHAKTIITNNSGDREETVTANQRTGATAIQHQKIIIGAEPPDLQIKARVQTMSGAGAAASPQITITNHPQKETAGEVTAKAAAIAVASQKTIIK